MDNWSNSTLLKGNKVAGIHLNILANGTWSMNVTLLEKKKKIIRITSDKKALTDIETLKDFLPVSVPVILSIEGKGIIHRKIKETGKNNLVNQVFPNAQASDFYTQCGDIENEFLILSLIRYDTVFEILKQFRESGFYTYNIILGPFALNCIFPILDTQTNEYLIDSYKINTKENIITNLEVLSSLNHQSAISIGNDLIDSDLLIPYANAISFYANRSFPFSVSKDINKINREEYIFKRTFEITSFSFLGLLFVSLLINFILYDFFNMKYMEANLKYKSGIELVTTLNDLKTEFNLKETLIKENGLISNTKFSYQADRIAAQVPPQIMLTRIEINPLVSKLKTGKEPEIKKNTIQISGKCQSSLVLGDFLENLSKEYLIKNIVLQQYSQENKLIPGDFLIQVDY